MILYTRWPRRVQCARLVTYITIISVFERNDKFKEKQQINDRSVRGVFLPVTVVPLYVRSGSPVRSVIPLRYLDKLAVFSARQTNSTANNNNAFNIDRNMYKLWWIWWIKGFRVKTLGRKQTKNVFRP